MEITAEMKSVFANMIVVKLKKSFDEHHITKNLINTITIDIMASGDVKIKIPAKIYDLKEWNKNKVIIYTGEGSYAEAVNQTGGYSPTKSHKNYIDKAIMESVVQWKNYYHIKG